MLEDSPGAFSLYVDWIYRSTLPTGNTEEHLHNLYDLYIFAEKLCLVELKDKTMDSIQDMAEKYDLNDELITVDLVSKVLLNTRSECEGLLLFLIYHMTCVDLNRYLDENEDDNNATELVMEKDIKNIHEIAINCNDFGFLEVLITRLMRTVKAMVTGKIDSRGLDEEGKFGRCFFHCHGKEVDCRAVIGASDSFLRKSDINKKA
jgi:hypothetical protein